MASTINASNSGFGGIVSTGDSSGQLQLQTAGTTAVTIDTSQNATFAGTVAMSSSFLRNRIINGAMEIDQRNAGASVSVSNGSVTFITDRWNVYEDTSGSMTSQQSSTAPAGFINSLLLTVTSAGTATASQLCRLQQRVEGLNVSDLAWGSASAKTITISFWVRSSLTGTYCVSIRNSAVNRSYVATYTISAANTWEQKSVTIAGDTSGTWLTTNGVGMYVSWDLGAGSNANTTAGSWVAGDKENTSAQANWIGTASATFYITGVQLEIGTSATPFERRLYNQELANCQRYYYNHVTGTLRAVSTAWYYNTTSASTLFFLPVTMRTVPSVEIASGTDYYAIERNGGTDTLNSFTYADGYLNSIRCYNNTEASGTGGVAGFVYTNNANAKISFNAEL